jgi:predicted MFS family arabinose efflux permease
VALLPEEERGFGNGLQVGAYRLGMIAGGAGIPVVYVSVGPAAAFLSMAAALALATLPAVIAREPPRVHTPATLAPRTVLAPLLSRRMWPWIGALALFKAGDALSGTMVKAMLVDQGWSLIDVGLLMGLGGSTFGMVGALAGGAATGWIGRRSALLWFGAAQAIPQAGFGRLDPTAMVLLEHVVSGMATAALFTAMMDRCERPGMEATDYTLQASLVVLFGGLASTLSGVVAAQIGYLWLFPLCGALSVLGAAWSAWAVGQPGARSIFPSA